MPTSNMKMEKHSEQPAKMESHANHGAKWGWKLEIKSQEICRCRMPVSFSLFSTDILK